VVETNGLENRYARKGIASSNLAPSALSGKMRYPGDGIGGFKSSLFVQERSD
jgi:hypothetical protein